jgi:hypothetical protein
MSTPDEYSRGFINGRKSGYKDGYNDAVRAFLSASFDSFPCSESPSPFIDGMRYALIKVFLKCLKLTETNEAKISV